ncbi:hypothetical protein V502_03930 [Pseudogymnoascus sp. VKM F-4520 (FW-2644)]|nr:hypothetical protein V502_03930 [Pseudogymnoascus sp. VKM F-4520 (FW-2644)]
MSSPNAPRTPLKPTNKVNGTPKSPESTKKMAPAPPDGGNVVKKRIPSQNVKTNAPENKTASPRPKPPKASDDQLPQSPTPDPSSKRHSVTDAPPPKFKAATPDQGDAAKPVIKKMKKASPPADVGNEEQNQVNELEKRVKKTKKQVPKPHDDAGGKVRQPEQLQHSAEMAKPKFKTPDVDSGEKPKTVMKKKPAPPPEPEQESENEDEVVSNHDDDEEDQGGDYEDNENEDDYHEKPEQEDSNEEIQADEAGSGWDEEHKTRDAEGGDDYDGNSEEEHGDVTDEDQDTLSQHGNGVSTASEKASKPARATDDAANPAKDIKRKVQKKSTPDTSDTAKYQHADPELLDELVKDPDAVFGEDMDALGVAHAGVPGEDMDLESKGVNANRTMENTTVLQSGGGGGIGINANGTEINIQTTKDGTSVTIKIPGAPKQ